MANNKHLEILKRGVKTWNEWRRENPKEKPDFSHANLSNAYLYGADLSYADLSNANLTNANLAMANLKYTDLSNANLKHTNLISSDLRNAVFYRANFVGANLGHTNLINVNFQNAVLYHADFNYANLSNANLIDANLAMANLSHANLSNAYLYGADLSYADLSNANLADANLERAILVETNLEKTKLSNCKIYGISAWNVKLDKDTVQTDLVITKEEEPIITVDNLEVAQFIYLILNHKKLRNAIDAVTNKGVLILGRFGGGGLEILQAIASEIRKMNYLPIIFNFDRPQDRNYTETVKTLAGLARFVIVDLSGPSVPQELYATVPHYKIPFVPIMEKGKHPYSMFVDILEYDWVLGPVIEFQNQDELMKLLPEKIIKPAEKRVRARKRKLAALDKP